MKASTSRTPCTSGTTRVSSSNYAFSTPPIRARAPEAPARLAERVTAVVQEMRTADLYKMPGVSETIDWVTALVALDRDTLDADAIDETLGVVLKAKEDLEALRGRRASELLD